MSTNNSFRKNANRPIHAFCATALGAFLAISSNGQATATFAPKLEDIQSCAGHYQASADTVIAVQPDGGRLNLMINSGPPMEFAPEAKDHFVNEQSGAKIHFVRDAGDHVTELVLERNGEHSAKRIEDFSTVFSLASEQVRQMQVGGKSFRVVIRGDGKRPVVFISGIGNWAKVAEGIGGRARVVRYEESGPNASPPLNVATQVGLLHSLLTSLNVGQPFILVGWSYGGALARLYADVYPKEIGGLVLVDPFDESFVDWLQSNQPKNYQIFRQRGVEHYVADWDDFIQRLHAARVPASTPVVMLNAGHREIRQGDALENQIESEDFQQGDKAVSQAHAAWIAKIPGGHLVVVPNAGHDIPGEQSGYVVQAILGELAEITNAAK